MIKTISHLLNAVRFIQLPKDQRILTFYSEGKNYWPYLEGLIREFLATSNIPICYVSSGEDDPGLFFEHRNYRAFRIDDRFVRDWFFKNINTSVMVMTMPDLHNYQVKRSKHKVHYVYIQHSLVSLHMAYRNKAFDHYDTVFCAGPHHIKEILAMEEKYNLPKKNLVEHGYGLLDAIIEEASQRPQKQKSIDNPKHVLVAPSWGPNAMIESGLGVEIISQLLIQGFKVTLRPHPQTTKLNTKVKVDAILAKHSNNSMFFYEDSVTGKESLHDSDFMISDWSGVALEYSLGLNKPVIFLDLPKKNNNPKYEEINVVPLEVLIRDKIGVTVGINDITHSLINALSYTPADLTKYIFNIGKSDFYGVKYILDLADDLWYKKGN